MMVINFEHWIAGNLHPCKAQKMLVYVLCELYLNEAERKTRKRPYYSNRGLRTSPITFVPPPSPENSSPNRIYKLSWSFKIQSVDFTWSSKSVQPFAASQFYDFRRFNLLLYRGLEVSTPDFSTFATQEETVLSEPARWFYGERDRNAESQAPDKIYWIIVYISEKDPGNKNTLLLELEYWYAYSFKSKHPWG